MWWTSWHSIIFENDCVFFTYKSSEAILNLAFKTWWSLLEDAKEGEAKIALEFKEIWQKTCVTIWFIVVIVPRTMFAAIATVLKVSKDTIFCFFLLFSHSNFRMSYLDRVNQEYWDFNEAASEFINKHHGSKEEGLTALSNELSFKKGQVAHLWKKNWKVSKSIINQKIHN